MTQKRYTEHILSRCEPKDEETGCIQWTGAMSSRKPGDMAAIPVIGIMADGKRTVRTCASVLWREAGRYLPSGHVVWRTCCNEDRKCLNIDHMKSGTRAQRQTFFSKGGAWKGNPIRIAGIMARAEKIRTSREDVREIERLLASGVLNREIKAQLGHSLPLISRVRTGKHPYSANREALIPGASVFSFGQGRR